MPALGLVPGYTCHMTYALLRRAGLEFPLSRASGHNCHGTASKHLLSNLDNLRSVRPGVLHGNTVEALPRALAPHSSLRLLPARFAKLAPRGAKFSPGGRLGRLGPSWAQAGAGKGERARETAFIVKADRFQRSSRQGFRCRSSTPMMLPVLP